MSQAAVPAPNPVPVPDSQPPSLRQWVRDHDESWIFVVVYLGLAVGLSVFVSLFWLVLVAGLHFLLEIFRQRFYRANRKSVVLHALWEVKLDVGLVLLALMLVLYIEVVLGILGVQSAARAAAVSRAGARIGTRAAAWERNLRTFLLTVDEMIRVGHAGVLLRKKRKEDRAKRLRLMGEGVGDVDAAGPPEGVEPGSPGRVAPEVAGGAVAPRPATEESGSADEPATGAAAEPGTADASDTAPDADTASGAAAAPDAVSAPDAAAAPDAAIAPEPTPAPVAPSSRSELGELPAPEPVPDDPERGAQFATPRGRARPVPRPDAWSGRWKLSDRIGIALVVLGFFLIGVAPYLTDHDWRSARAALAEELRPFPSSDEPAADELESTGPGPDGPGDGQAGVPAGT
jgi:hypothetical protein